MIARLLKHPYRLETHAEIFTGYTTSCLDVLNTFQKTQREDGGEKVGNMLVPAQVGLMGLWQPLTLFSPLVLVFANFSKDV